VHGVWEPLLAWAARAAVRLHVPYAVAPHGMLYPWSLNQKRLKKRLALALGYRRMLENSAFLHALNQSEEDAIAECRLKPPIWVIANGIFTEEFETLPPPGEFRRQFPALGTHPYILFLSRLHPGKGLNLLAHAFSLLARRNADAHLVIAGPDFGAAGEFRKIIADLGIADRVHLVGALYGAAKLASFVDATCFCLPSEHETFSMAIVESLACGVPAVISESCHFDEVRDVGAGLVVPRTPEAVAEALTRLMEDEAARREMGRRGREFVFENYRWPNIARQTIDAYAGWACPAPPASAQRPLRILHVLDRVDPAAGGPPAVAFRLAAAQAAQGHAVTILSYQPLALAEMQVEMQGIPSIALVGLELLPPKDPKEHLWPRQASQRLHQLLPDVDIVHLHGVWESLLRVAANQSRRLGKPYIVTPHGMLEPWALSRKWFKKQIALLIAYGRMIDAAAAIHFLNSVEFDIALPLRLSAPAVIIPNGVFLEEMSRPPEPADLRASHPRLPDKPYILFLGRLHYKKGLDFLADAFSIVARALPDVQLVVVGPDDRERAPFEQRVRHAHLAERVHLLGPLYGAAKLAAYAGAACFCLPSRQEGFSMAILEAMACGVPVVISEACHFPEATRAGAGYVVPLHVSAIADALLAVLKDPQSKQRMGQAGRRLVSTRFTWPAIARQHIEAYQVALERQAQRRR